MSQNNSNDKAAMLARIETINKVDGFDPTPFAVDYTDLETGEVRKRLPVMIQMAWFRMKYPEGRIAITVSPGKDCFIATAKVYPNYKDGADCYLAEATASRGYLADKPSVSPREWAQTAAVGIALRNAGFGLQFAMAGDEFENAAPDELSGRISHENSCDASEPEPAEEYINLKKEVFRCPRCGVSGGIFDLYALYTGIPRDGVRKAILDRMGVPETVLRPQKNIPTKAETECPLTDIDTRHATYSALLSRLTLAPDHKENLLGRGLTDSDIQRLGYKTTPVVGMAQIAKQLRSDGLYLAGVPGFYRDDSGAWNFVHEKRGILIPVRDRFGRIQGLQIRRDNVEKRKFRWVSSAEKKDGCKAEGWTHLSGPVRPMLILTEGPMKADVIHALTGLTVLAVPGVNTLTQLELTLTDLRSEGLTEIKTAFDMDFATNHHVQNGYNRLLQLLGDMGFRYGTYLWNPAYKGLDDYIWEYLFRKKQSQ